MTNQFPDAPTNHGGFPAPPAQAPPFSPPPAQPPGGQAPPTQAPPFAAPGQPVGPPTDATTTSKGVTTPGFVIWSLTSVVMMVVAVSIPEDGDNQWVRIGIWAGFAVLCSLATLLPLFHQTVKASPRRLWDISAAGAAGLIAFWVLFVLPSISQNVSFVATVAVAAGCMAVWTAPGRPKDPSGSGETW